MKKIFLAVVGIFVFATAILADGFPTASPTVRTASAQTVSTRPTAEITATFTIANMTCALCPVTVKSAMKRVKGVKSVHIDFDAKTATVVFDPSVATTEAIAAASTNAGYPAAAKG